MVRSSHRGAALAALAALALILGLAPSATGATAATAHGRTVYVAPHGSDAASGSRSAPLATVRHALAVLGAAGGTVRLRGGRYAQRISLHDARNVTVEAAPGEHPVLDGSTLTVPTGTTAMVEIDGSTDVTVRGLDITGYRTSRIDAVPIGVYVHGGDTGVRIEDNHVHAMGNDNDTMGSMDMNAHGIAVYGDSASRPVRGLVIDGNEVDHLKLGASESVVVNGNVDGWRITRNRIHDDNNIGIDAIGYEDTLTGSHRYTEQNRARNGYIGSNTVTNIKSEGNPAYYEDGQWCNCADGIYVDGGTHIVIDRNTVAKDDIGIEVAAENGRGQADHVVVVGNRVSLSRYVGITTGGYCDGAEACGGVQTGKSFDNVFVGNHLRNDNTDDDGSPEFLVQYHERDNVIVGNTVCAAGGNKTLLGTVPDSDSGHGDVVFGNHYGVDGGSKAGAVFGWAGHTYTGLDAYRKATGNDPFGGFSTHC